MLMVTFDVSGSGKWQLLSAIYLLAFLNGIEFGDKSMQTSSFYFVEAVLNALCHNLLHFSVN